MTLNEFLTFVKTGQALSSPEIHELMNRMSNEARKITFRLNSAYHTPEEVNALLSELFGKPVPDSLRVFPPFYSDFGKNIQVGENVLPKEYNLLVYMTTHAGRVISRIEIAEKVWNTHFDTGTNFIDVYINYLRKKIDKDFEPKLIHTKLGVGFILTDAL